MGAQTATRIFQNIIRLRLFLATSWEVQRHPNNKWSSKEETCSCKYPTTNLSHKTQEITDLPVAILLFKTSRTIPISEELGRHRYESGHPSKIQYKINNEL